jgi:hypothetical protein
MKHTTPAKQQEPTSSLVQYKAKIIALFDTNPVLRNHVVRIVLFCIPIALFNIKLLASGHKITPGDPDYYFQIYEAFRVSIVHYHQFPLWNPWIAGGIPLFANIQFGLVSLQAPLVLLFGAVIGLKMSIIFYQIFAFFGFKQLFEKGFKTPKIRAILLAYIPVFGSFFVYRTIAGHFTFLLVAFVPWLILFYLQRTKKLSWLWFAITYSFMVWSSPHYITIMGITVVALWFLYELIGRTYKQYRAHELRNFWKSLKPDVTFWVKAGVAIGLLTAYRMYYVLSFIKDFPRPESADAEGFTGIGKGLYAIWGPNQYNYQPHLASGFGWVEASTYIGIGTLICLLIIGFVYLQVRLKKQKQTVFSYPLLLLVALFLTFFILGMGDFGKFSPYIVLNKFPIFSSMRVATRWLMWASLTSLFILAAYRSKRFAKTINIILFLTVIELFATGYGMMGKTFVVQPQQYRSTYASFDQEFHYRVPRPQYANDANFQAVYPYDENLYETTLNNRGQVIAGDSLVDTRQPNTTIRCGANEGGCNFISTNARVQYWSPNKIILVRTATGPINININPGKGWMVNGAYVFGGDKITNPKSAFIINDPSHTITLQYAPTLSPSWLEHKISR